jgi:outer membrane murein-binding lipoprotein Lpp
MKDRYKKHTEAVADMEAECERLEAIVDGCNEELKAAKAALAAAVSRLRTLARGPDAQLPLPGTDEGGDE